MKTFMHQLMAGIIGGVVVLFIGIWIHSPSEADVSITHEALSVGEGPALEAFANYLKSKKVPAKVLEELTAPYQIANGFVVQNYVVRNNGDRVLNNIEVILPEHIAATVSSGGNHTSVTIPVFARLLQRCDPHRRELSQFAHSCLLCLERMGTTPIPTPKAYSAG